MMLEGSGSKQWPNSLGPGLSSDSHSHHRSHTGSSPSSSSTTIDSAPNTKAQLAAIDTVTTRSSPSLASSEKTLPDTAINPSTISTTDEFDAASTSSPAGPDDATQVDTNSGGRWKRTDKVSAALAFGIDTEDWAKEVTNSRGDVAQTKQTTVEPPPTLPSISDPSPTSAPSATSSRAGSIAPAVPTIPPSSQSPQHSPSFSSSATLALLAELQQRQLQDQQGPITTSGTVSSISTPRQSEEGVASTSACSIDTGHHSEHITITTENSNTNSNQEVGSSRVGDHRTQESTLPPPPFARVTSTSTSPELEGNVSGTTTPSTTKASTEARLPNEADSESSSTTIWSRSRISRLYSGLLAPFSRSKNTGKSQPEDYHEAAKSTFSPSIIVTGDDEDHRSTSPATKVSNPAFQSEEGLAETNWTRTSSIGSIQGLLTSAFDYLVAVAPSRSASISEFLQVTPSSLPVASTSVSQPLESENRSEAISKTQSSLDDTKSTESVDSNTTTSPSTLPSPSKSRSLATAPGGNPPSSTPLATSPSSSFSIPSRLQAAYQSITSTASSLTPSQNPAPTQASARASSQEELEAILQGQQRHGKAHRRNSTNTHTTQSNHSTMRREKYTDYFRDSASPPPLPIPSSSTRNPVSRSTTPHASATTSTSPSTPSRRNTLDSMTASFSSLYTSNTSVASPPPSSSHRERDRDYHRSSKDKERSGRSDRPLSPDLYIAPHANNYTPNGIIIPRSSSPPPQADSFTTLRLEDRCRHLEKTVKELQSKLRSKDQDIKMRDSELRSVETELHTKDMDLRAKDGDVKEKEVELRAKQGELRKKEVELRDREGQLREVEGMLQKMVAEVSWRDAELDRLRAREREWEREKESAMQNRGGSGRSSRKGSTASSELAGRKRSDRPDEHSENLEKELKRRASVTPLIMENGRSMSGKHNSPDMKAAHPGSTHRNKVSASAPSEASLANAYSEMKRQKESTASSSSGSRSESSESSQSDSTRRTGNSIQASPTTSPSASPAPQQPRNASQTRSQPHPQPHLTIPKTTPSPLPSLPTPTLPYSEAQAQQRSEDTFLTRTDSWSGAQVLQAVNDINSEVVQFAAVVTEMSRFAPREVPSPSPSPNPYSLSSSSSSKKASGTDEMAGNPLNRTKSFADTATRLGDPLTHLLATYDHSNDPILVQLALQACVCVAAKKAWETFCLGLPAKSDGVLGVIYRSLKELEPQPTSSKWRSLTHGHIHAIYPTLAAYSANELAETMLRWTVDILTLAGCVGIDSASAVSTTPTNATGDTLASYGLNNPPTALRTQRTTNLLLPQLLHITRALTRLENVLRQDILSTTFDLVIPEYGMAFEKGWMVDFFGYDSDSGISSPEPLPGQGGQPTKVLGSVEVGLMCRTRLGVRGGGGGVTPTATTPMVSSGNGLPLGNGGGGSILGGQGTNMSQQQGGGEARAVYEERLLLMPKVILESVVDLL